MGVAVGVGRGLVCERWPMTLCNAVFDEPFRPVRRVVKVNHHTGGFALAGLDLGLETVMAGVMVRVMVKFMVRVWLGSELELGLGFGPRC